MEFAKFPLVFVGIIILQRLLELRLARRNEAWARSRGAVEYGAAHYPLFFILHSLWLLGLIIEALTRGNFGPAWPLWFGIWCLAQLGRYWVIVSLGPLWNTRILIVPGEKRVRTGPYRWFEHPNYLVVALELFSAPLVFGAWITALVATIANAWLLLFVRIPLEEKALERYRDAAQAKSR